MGFYFTYKSRNYLRLLFISGVWGRRAGKVGGGGGGGVGFHS